MRRGGGGGGLAGPDLPNLNLAKFWGGGRDTAVQTDWRVVMVRLARRDWAKSPTGEMADGIV